MTWTASFYYVFVLFCVILYYFSIYVIFIWVCSILMAYAISTTCLLRSLHKKFSSCEPKEELPHAGWYNYNGRQIEPFHINWFNFG